MTREWSLPDTERLSTLAASILLAYTLARFVDIPERQVTLQLPGIFLTLNINFRTFIAPLVAILTAAGANWLLRDHPKRSHKHTFEHWLLPALTALVIGFPIADLPFGPQWLLSLIVGGGLLMVVLIAEYIALDDDDVRQPLAAVGLTAVSFALFMTLAVLLRLNYVRLIYTLPVIFLASGVVSLRTLHLRLHSRWAFLEALTVATLTSQVCAALHYWPLSMVSFGLALLAPTYAVTSLVVGLSEDEPLRRALVEPLSVMTLLWGLAYWFR
ncbi:MAG: hypothetical protein PHS96_08115 [Anaerolineales bacterium]|nr:hypothetical protein [Anaerolineales bacterium]